MKPNRCCTARYWQFIGSEVAQFLNAEGKTLEQIELTPENLVEMIAIIEDGTISSKIAKKVFVHLAKNGGGAREYVEKKQVWFKSQILKS